MATEYRMSEIANGTGLLMLDQIRREVGNDPYYQQNFSNDGQRFVAWRLEAECDAYAGPMT
jgi:hypothetical protein